MVELPICKGKSLGSNPNISKFYFVCFFKTFPKNQQECSLYCETQNRNDYRGCSSVVERPFRIWNDLGLNPKISNFTFIRFSKPFPKNQKNVSWITQERSECRGCSLVVECAFRTGKVLVQIPISPNFISSVFQNLFQKPKECSLDCKTKDRCECRGCSSVVERPFRIGKSLVRIPISPYFIS